MKLLILGVARNVEETFPRTAACLEATMRAFPGSRTVVFENGSNDGSRALIASYDAFEALHEAAGDDQLVHQVVEARDLALGPPARMERIAWARNRLLRHVRGDLAGFDAVLWVDVDGGVFEAHDVRRALARREPWDALFANDIRREKRLKWEYYDRYALRDAIGPTGPEVDGDAWWQGLRRRFIPKWRRALLPVYSAFGGLGLYRPQVFEELDFLAYPDEAVLRVYRRILGRDAVELVPNSGYGFPVICEHVGLCFRMIDRGMDRLFIDPRLRYYREPPPRLAGHSP